MFTPKANFSFQYTVYLLIGQNQLCQVCGDLMKATDTSVHAHVHT